MTQFESSVKHIPHPVSKVYNTLSDLNNLSRLEGVVPTDKIQNLQFDTDMCSFSVSPIGEVSLRIIERETDKTVKLGTEKSPVACNLWIQMLPVSETESKIKLTIRAELNPFIKGMVSKPLQEGIEKMATLLASIPY